MENEMLNIMGHPVFIAYLLFLALLGMGFYWGYVQALRDHVLKKTKK